MLLISDLKLHEPYLAVTSSFTCWHIISLWNTKKLFQGQRNIITVHKSKCFISVHFRWSTGSNHSALQGIDGEKKEKKTSRHWEKKKKRLEEIGGLMPSQWQCPTRAPRSFTIAMKLPSVMKRWLQVSHLQPSCTYAQSERSRNPRRFRPPSRLSLQSSESKAWMFRESGSFRKGAFWRQVLGFVIVAVPPPWNNGTRSF